MHTTSRAPYRPGPPAHRALRSADYAYQMATLAAALLLLLSAAVL